MCLQLESDKCKLDSDENMHLLSSKIPPPLPLPSPTTFQSPTSILPLPPAFHPLLPPLPPLSPLPLPSTPNSIPFPSLHSPTALLSGSKHLPFTFTEAGNITLLHSCQAHERLFFFCLPSANKRFCMLGIGFPLQEGGENMRFVQLGFLLELIAGTASIYKKGFPSSKTKNLATELEGTTTAGADDGSRVCDVFSSGYLSPPKRLHVTPVEDLAS